jgi:hypothetical protein
MVQVEHDGYHLGVLNLEATKKISSALKSTKRA